MKIINVNLKNDKYDIIIEKGLIKNIGNEIKKIYTNRKIVIITDININRIYGCTVKNSLLFHDYEPNFIVIEPGEKSKSIEELIKIYNNLISFNITRGDMIIALGGGVVGDLAGFAAATYLRGVNYIQIPTSLLAQIDSSIGGKVAVNLEQGKNLIGNFYQPKRVIIDPDVLYTLPSRFIKDGLGETIKYACIKDAVLFETLMNIKSKQTLLDNIEEIIYKCCTIKKEIVEHDEKDNGERMILNFGHTFGHAIEKYFNYEKFTHGEAVALGMYYITRKSESLSCTEANVSEKIRELLVKFNIQYDLLDLDMNKIKKYILRDKKNISNHINLILLKKIGQSYIHKIPIERLNEFF